MSVPRSDDTNAIAPVDPFLDAISCDSRPTLMLRDDSRSRRLTLGRRSLTHGRSRRDHVVALGSSPSSVATASGQVPRTLASPGGCFTKVATDVCAGICGASRVVRGVGGLGSGAAGDPIGRSRALSGPGGCYLVPVELQQVVGRGD